MASPPIWQHPTLEEFLADVEDRRNQPVLYNSNDMILATNFLAETGQDRDPAELVEARNMALAKQGLFASCTPTMAWNYHFGDIEAFYAERFAQVNAQDAVVEPEVASCRTVGCGGCRYRILRRVCIVVLFSIIAQIISRSLSNTISNTV
jgi:hypothetical protein